MAGALSIAALTSGAAQAAGPEWRQHGLPLLKAVAFGFKGGFGKIVLGAKELTWTGVTGSGTIETPNKVSKATIVFTGTCSKAILLTGSVLGALTPANSETTKLIASFPLFSGKDRYTAFEGEGTQHVLRYKESGGLEGEAPFECNEEELATSEAVEAKAEQNRVGTGLAPAPPTPPDMRVRIRRFAQRSRERR